MLSFVSKRSQWFVYFLSCVFFPFCDTKPISDFFLYLWIISVFYVYQFLYKCISLLYFYLFFYLLDPVFRHNENNFITSCILSEKYPDFTLAWYVSSIEKFYFNWYSNMCNTLILSLSRMDNLFLCDKCTECVVFRKKQFFVCLWIWKDRCKRFKGRSNPI